MKNPPSPIQTLFTSVVSRETIAKVELYVSLLLKWQQSINLVSAATADHVWERHIQDAAQLFPLLPSSDITLVDIGSGAGLPGFVLAMMGVRDVHLIEVDRRKAEFLREAARITNTPITLHIKRAADVFIPACDVITARAVAELDALLSLTEHLRQPSTFCLFPKGENYRIECDTARMHWNFEMQTVPSCTGPGVILALTQVHKKSS